MRNARITIFLLLPLILGTGCGGRKTVSEDDSDARLAFAKEDNKVEVITLQRTDFPLQILSNGKVHARRKASLSFRTQGTISRIGVRNGERVAKGAVVARLDRPDLDLAAESARIALDKAKLDLLDFLAGQGYAAGDTASVPKGVMEIARMRSGYTAARNALARARYDLEGAVLKAPFSGIVADLSARAFDPAPATPLCTLIDDRQMEVEFSVMEADYGKVSPGMTMRVEPFAQGGSEIRGSVTEINPSIGKNGLVTVRGGVPGGGGLVDGMNVKVLLEKSLPGQLVVPKEAVVVRDGLNVLFTYTDDGTAHWTYVRILDANSESYAVEANFERNSRLVEGDMVIVRGNLNLADGSKVSLR